MALIIGMMVGLGSLPIMVLGLEFIWLGLRTHLGHPFYVPYDYFLQGGIWLVWGLLIFALGLLPLSRRKGSAAAVVLAGILLIVAAIAIPSNRMPVHIKQMAEDGVLAAVRRTNTTLAVGADDARQFPAGQAELDELVRKSGDPDWKWKSLYARDSQRLAYRPIHIAGAAGPQLSPMKDDPPGTIYCAVSPDLKKVWVTGTVLDDAVAGEVQLMQDHERRGPRIEQYQLDPTAVPPPVGGAGGKAATIPGR